jgi:hypothetical protein
MRNTNAIEAHPDNPVHQLELGFAGKRAGEPAWLTRRQRRTQRAQWWFRQMRRVVDRAMDWQTAPPARPEQAYLTLARRRNW